VSVAVTVPLGKTELARRIRAAAVTHVVDAGGYGARRAANEQGAFSSAVMDGGSAGHAGADSTGADPDGTAIYTLADPHDLAAVRYVGQTRSPRRRFVQHLASARLWMPDEIPWWIVSPRLRPLYDWIRALHRDDYRLPVMVIAEWVTRASDALSAERALIERCLREGAALLNVEAERTGPQIPLL
jgi:hypothetical protein